MSVIKMAWCAPGRPCRRSLALLALWTSLCWVVFRHADQKAHVVENLKGQCDEIFDFRFLTLIMFLFILSALAILLKIREDIRFSSCTLAANGNTEKIFFSPVTVYLYGIF
jgi:hypothetical protein